MIFLCLLFLSLCIVGCNNNEYIEKKENKRYKFEVLLSTKDTIYIDAYDGYEQTGMFGPNKSYLFYGQPGYRDFIMRVDNPIYIKVIKKYN